jgi:hypothetical protein
MPVKDDSIICKKYGRLTVVERIYKNNRTWRIKCICDCGKEYLTHLSPLKRGITKSCGCLQKERASQANTKDISGQKFGKLTVIKRANKVITKKGYQYYNYECICDCGNKVFVRPSHLISGHTKTCGCSLVEKTDKWIGKKIGKNIVIKKIIENNNTIKYLVRCDCGTERIVPYDNMINRKSCGKCNLIINGKKSSFITLNFYKKLGFGEHNYNIEDKFGGRKMNVDIAILEEKIVIEYDCLYWHKNSEIKDLKKTKRLLNNGWKVLRIRSNYSLPKKEEINCLLNILRKTDQEVIIFNINDGKK